MFFFVISTPWTLKVFLIGRYNWISYVLCLQMYPWVAALRKHLGETLVNGFLSYPRFTSDATIIAGISKVLCVLKYSSIPHNRTVALKSRSPTHCAVDLAPAAESTEACPGWFSPSNFPWLPGMEPRFSHPSQAFLTQGAATAAHSSSGVCVSWRGLGMEGPSNLHSSRHCEMLYSSTRNTPRPSFGISKSHFFWEGGYSILVLFVFFPQLLMSLPLFCVFVAEIDTENYLF